MILRDPRFKRCSYKGGLYLDCGEVFPEAIAAVLKRPGNAIILEEPTGVALALGRKPGKLSTSPVSPKPRLGPTEESSTPSVEQLVAVLRDAQDWNQVAETPADRVRSSKRIRAGPSGRTTARDENLFASSLRGLGRAGPQPEPAQGLDGSRLRRRGGFAVVDPAGCTERRGTRPLHAVARRPGRRTGRRPPLAQSAILDRLSREDGGFPALERRPSAQSASLCREYLALSDAEAKKLGPPQFEEAARALLAASPQTETALELMKHRLQEVRGRAILVCLAHIREPWALAALTEGAPFALKMRTDRD